MSNPREVIIENGENHITRLPVATERQTRKTRKGLLKKLLKVAGRIPFAEDIAAAYYCATDKQTPQQVRLVLFSALFYFLSPVDAIPDIIAGIGFTDDASVLAATLAVVGSHITPDHRASARKLLGLSPAR